MKNELPARRGGFTLIEMLVVMAIIMVLMGIAIGIAGVAQRNAAEARARAEIENLSLEIERHKSDEGSYPLNLQALVTWYRQRYAGTPYDVTDLDEADRPLDPWGRTYRYRRENPFIFTVRSRGADGEWDTEADITNREN